MGPRVCLLLPPTLKTFGRGKLGFFSSTIIFVFAFIGGDWRKIRFSITLRRRFVNRAYADS
jgi:hypothetical protein